MTAGLLRLCYPHTGTPRRTQAPAVAKPCELTAQASAPNVNPFHHRAGYANGTASGSAPASQSATRPAAPRRHDSQPHSQRFHTSTTASDTASDTASVRARGCSVKCAAPSAAVDSSNGYASGYLHKPQTGYLYKSIPYCDYRFPSWAPHTAPMPTAPELENPPPCGFFLACSPRRKTGKAASRHRASMPAQRTMVLPLSLRH